MYEPGGNETVFYKRAIDACAELKISTTNLLSTIRPQSDKRYTLVPNIDILHGGNFSGMRKHLRSSKTHVYSLEGWGSLSESLSGQSAALGSF